MTSTDDDSNLEILLAKAANPLNKELDMEAVSAFHECMSEEPEGPQTALRFLAHRIQSPQEKEAMMALLVLEECVRKSDPRFLNEIGKFRFLNELIKVVSPKYLGNRAPSKVKQKILELMFKWSVELKHESKINEAYQMLRKQGVISEDPVHVLEHYEPPEAPSPRPQNPIFEDEEKSKLLQTLLQSKDPDDLQAANRLIKSMVKEADRRMELMARTMTELEAVHNNAVVLSDMLDHYTPGKTSEEEKDLMKELFESCERLRPKLFRLAGEMDEKDSGLDDILRANDKLTVVITKYRKIMGMEDGVVFDLTAHSKTPTAASAVSYEASLMDLGSPVSNTTAGSSSSKSKTEISFLDDQLLSLGLNDAPDIPQSNSSFGLLPNTTGNSASGNLLSELDTIFSTASATHINNPIPPTIGIGNSVLQPTNIKSEVKLPVVESQNLKPKHVSGLDELDVIGQSLLKQSLPQNITKMEFPSTPQKVPMSQLQSRPSAAATSAQILAPQSQPSLLTSLSETTVFTSSNTASPSRGNDPFSLAEIFVPLETIQPGVLPPLTLRDKDGLAVVVHFGKDSPRDDVTVMVVSTMNKNTKAQFKNVKFQAAVPKTMKIKLQPPSATDLPPYNPILPAAITQVMLLANPNKDKVRLKYKITYTMNDENKTDVGEVDSLLAAR